MSRLKKRYDVTTNEKFLKEKSRVVTELNSEVRTVTELLLEHMKAYPEKQGVSAVQLGYLVRAHALRINNEVTVMYNLEFVHKFLYQFFYRVGSDSHRILILFPPRSLIPS